MKVAYLIGSLHRGGAETLVLDVLKNASIAPFDVIGVFRKIGEYEEDFRKTNQPIYQCAPQRYNYVRYIRLLRSILLKEEITVVHTQQALDCIYAWFALHFFSNKRLRSIKLVTTFHGFNSGSLLGMHLKNAIAMLCANKICFVSKYQQGEYDKQYTILNMRKHHNVSCINVVYNGVDFSKLDSISKNSLYSTLNSSLPKLCMVGNFNHVRSQIVICRALAKVSQPLEFYFIGRKVDGEEKLYNACEEYCQTHNLSFVHFLGGRGDVPNLLRQMDGFVYSTECDTFGIATIEAAACGVPVLINDHPVMKEVLGINAMYYLSGNSEDCAEKIDELLKNIDIKKQDAQSLMPSIRQKYSIQNHILHLTELYNEI